MLDKSWTKTAAIFAIAFIAFSCQEEKEAIKPAQEKANEQKRPLSEIGYSSTDEMLADGWIKLESEVLEYPNKADQKDENARAQASGIQQKLTFQNLSDMGFSHHRLKELVTNHFDRSPDGISINGERIYNAPLNPTITEEYGHSAYIETGEPTVTFTSGYHNLNVVYDYTFHNYSGEEDSHTISRSYQKGRTTSWSSTTSVNVSVAGTVGLKGIADITVEVGVGTSATNGGSESEVITTQVSSTITVPPHSKRRVIFIEKVKEDAYYYDIPVKVSGTLGANFGDKLNGHYYWFTAIRPLLGSDGEQHEIGEVSNNDTYGGDIYAYEAEAL